MAAFIKHLVSKKKKRLQEDGFDLDLTYITDRIIAMGFPSEGTEGVYRNNMKDVQRFLESRHKGKYFVYNLCSERVYDPAKFKGAAERFPFDDHDPPQLPLIDKFVEHALGWLHANPDNLVVIHCKAGKGRTGTMIACLMLKAGWVETSEEALTIFGKARTENGKGVTIPSQIRFVGYYEQILQSRKANRPSPFSIPPVQLPVSKVILHTVPNFDHGGGCDPYIIIEIEGKKVFQSDPKIGCKNEKTVEIDCHSTIVAGNVRFQLMDKDSLKDDKMCHFWINTCFIENRKILLPKKEIDKALKDKECTHFSDNFAIEVIFGRSPEDVGLWDDWDSRRE